MAARLTDSISLQTHPPRTNSTRTSSTSKTRSVLIYFIPGNPGLIEYYRPFLTHLRSTLEPVAASAGATITVAGNSLAGFHVDGTRSTASDARTRLPLNLRQQIEDAERQIIRVSEAARASASDDGSLKKDQPVEVILIGHSVGAYIMMSLLGRQCHVAQAREAFAQQGTKIIAGIGLFPTVVDLYASPNGRKASWIAYVPGFSLFLQAVAKLLCYVISFAMLERLVSRFTGHPEAAARVTASFLASPMGVRQAIYLAQHELLEMREDRWSDEVWGAHTQTPDGKRKENTRPNASASSLTKSLSGDDTKSSRPALFFYWGANDHWISNRTRDAVIASRAALLSPTKTTPESLQAHNTSTAPTRSGPRMEIDQNGLPHDFCTAEKASVMVADRVAEYVREVLAVEITDQRVA